jgi:hypothetical protein
MPTSFRIDIVNFEQQAVRVDIASPVVAGVDEFVDPFLEGSDQPIILESVDVDDDKTKVIRGRRLTCGFNSTDEIPGAVTTLANNVDTFSDGDEDDFTVQLNISSGPGTIPFAGNLVLDDNTEAFQPRPNPVRLFASEGLASLRDVKLRESDGDIPVGHFRLIDYIYLCLNNLGVGIGPTVYIAMNLFEKSRYRKLSANFNITATNKFRIPYDQAGFLTLGDTIEITGSTLGNNGSYTITLITLNPTTSVDITVSTSTFVTETIEVWIFISNNHTFWDIMLNALTFETQTNERDDCLTVLNKILDAFGCFITYGDTGTAGGWYIIRWDEYDRITTGASTLRFAKFTFSSFAVFNNYELIDVDKIIAHDQDGLYEGYRLSMDNAVKRFQRRAHSVLHTYKFEQPNEIPCNSAFLRGTVDDDVLPLKTYVPDCWTIMNGFGSGSTAPTSDLRIWVRYDDNDNESERYLVLTPSPSSGDNNYAISEGIDISEKDKFEFSFDYSADTDNAIDGPASIFIAAIILYGDDTSVWVLGDNVVSGGPQTPEWKLSNVDLSVNADFAQWFFSATSGSEDYTQFRSYSIEAPPVPTDGQIFICLFAANQLGGIDDFAIRYNNLNFTYIPFITGAYHRVDGQQVKVTGTNDSKKNIEHEMFVGEPGKKLIKGALKKFDGKNYLLTETWNYYHDNTVLTDSKLAKHIVYQWWNQFRKTRTVIETDVQGLGANDVVDIPSMINRWKIIHGDQQDKKFMLTSFRNMNFSNCGWNGVFVESSSVDGDRNYDDAFEFKYIQE